MTPLPTIKQLNKPQSMDVQADARGVPRKVRLKPIEAHDLRKNRRTRHQLRGIRSDGQWMRIVSIEDRWKINDEWWRGEKLEIERLYFDVILENNQRMTVFHDLISDSWSRQAE